MNLEKRNILRRAGINYEDCLARFMNNEDLLTYFLKKFLLDKSFEKLCCALDIDDCEQALVAAHTLKGVSANLSLESLFQLTSKQTEYLRNEDLEAAKNLLPHITLAYQTVIDALSVV